MNDFDNLIIAAFRDKNFKFAEEAKDMDPVATALGMLNDKLNVILESRNYDTDLVTKIYSIFDNAKNYLTNKLGREVGVALSYERSTGIFSLIDTGDSQINEFYQFLMNKVLDRLGESATVTSPTSAVPTSTTTSTTEEEANPFDVSASDETTTSYENTDLVINIKTNDKSSRKVKLINNTEVGSKTSGGLDVEDNNAAATHLYFFKDEKNNFRWSVLATQIKNTYFNQRSMEAKIYPLKPGDTIYFGNTFVTIEEIVNSSNPTSTSGASSSSSEGVWNVDSSKSDSGGFFGGGSDDQSEPFGRPGFRGFGGRGR